MGNVQTTPSGTLRPGLALLLVHCIFLRKLASLYSESIHVDVVYEAVVETRVPMSSLRGAAGWSLVQV